MPRFPRPLAFYAASIDNQRQNLVVHHSARSLALTSASRSSNSSMANSDRIVVVNEAATIRKIYEPAANDDSSIWSLSDGYDEEGNKYPAIEHRMIDADISDFEDSSFDEIKNKRKIENNNNENYCKILKNQKNNNIYTNSRQIAQKFDVPGIAKTTNSVSSVYRNDTTIQNCMFDKQMIGNDNIKTVYAKGNENVKNNKCVNEEAFVLNNNNNNYNSYNNNNDREIKLQSMCPKLYTPNALFDDEDHTPRPQPQPSTAVPFCSLRDRKNIITHINPHRKIDLIKINSEKNYIENYKLNNADINTPDNECIYQPHRSQKHSISEILQPIEQISSTKNCIYNNQPPNSFSTRQHYNAVKLVVKNTTAFEAWLSAKRKLFSNELSLRMQKEEEERQKREARKKLSEMSFQNWLQKKSTSSTTTTFGNEKLKTSSSYSTTLSNRTSSTNSEIKVPRKIYSDEESKKRLEKWKKQKRALDEKKRLTEKREEEKRQNLKNKRRKAAEDAYNIWLKEAHKKPKPVPFNQGLLSLRGTLAQHFVNENEWVN